jgi:hypothetical protein
MNREVTNASNVGNAQPQIPIKELKMISADASYP